MQGCTDHGAPDWNSMIVVGPNKLRDGHGNVTLQWTVTVHCAPAVQVPPAPRLPDLEASNGGAPDPVEPSPSVDVAA